jgi:hypothetical protein
MNDQLIASGGWCAPSQVSYDDYDATPDWYIPGELLELPKIGIRRGGIVWPTNRPPKPRPVKNYMSDDPSFGSFQPLDLGVWT